MHNHIAGQANVMADDASRRWDLSDSELISHFNLAHPQASPWHMLHLSSATNSKLTGALFKRRRRIASPPNVPSPPRAPGTSGPLSVAASVWTPLPCRTTPFPFSKSSPSVSAPAPFLPVVDWSGLAAWKTLSVAWARHPPPSRVKPLPPSLLAQVVHLARTENTDASRAVAAVLTLGFFFLLLRPGEYLGMPNDATDNMFRLRDLSFKVGARALRHYDCPIPDLHATTFVTLTFTCQKNGVRNETVGHGRSGHPHPHLCPVLCLVERVIALRAFHANLAT